MNNALSLAALIAGIALIVILGANSKNLGGPTPGATDPKQINPALEASQASAASSTGKYPQIKSGNPRVDEYQAPGGIGWQAYETEVRADGTYTRSYGVGPEAKDRSFDWKLTEPSIATSTP